jgi:phage gp36-like protein
MYCTQADIRKLLPAEEIAALTDDAGGDTVNAPVLLEAIHEADSIIDGFLAKRYAVPVRPVPALVRGLSRAIAIQRLYQRREHVPEVRQKAYEDALEILRAIESGKLTLGVDPAPKPSQTQQAQSSASPHVFSRLSLRDF